MNPIYWNSSVQFSSVAQSSPTLCDPMNRSTPSLPVHHHLPEFTQTHVHRVSDSIQPSHPSSVIPFSSCPQSLPASESFPMSQLFAWGGQSIRVSASTSVSVSISLYNLHLYLFSLYLFSLYLPPSFNLSQHQGLFKWVSSSHQVAQVLEYICRYTGIYSSQQFYEARIPIIPIIQMRKWQMWEITQLARGSAQNETQATVSKGLLRSKALSPSPPVAIPTHHLLATCSHTWNLRVSVLFRTSEQV